MRYTAVFLFLILVQMHSMTQALSDDCARACGTSWTGTCARFRPVADVDGQDTTTSTGSFECVPPTGPNMTLILDGPSDNATASASSFPVLNVDTLDSLSSSFVTALTLNATGSASLNASFTLDFPSLTSLSISHVNLPTDLTRQLPSSLHTLQLQDNGLSDLDLTSTPLLTSLDLSLNALATIPSSIYSLVHLQSLNLTGNPIDANNLTSSQAAFLSSLTSFQADWTRCGSLQHVSWSNSSSQLSLDCSSATSIHVTSDANSNSTTSMTVVLIGVGVGLLLLIVVFIIVWRRRAAQDNLRDHSMEQIYQSAFKSAKAMSTNVPSSRQPVSILKGTGGSNRLLQSFVESAFHAKYAADPEFTKWRVPLDSLVCTRLVGHSRNNIYEIWVGQMDDKQIAIKKLSPAVAEAAASATDMPADEVPAIQLLEEMRSLGRLEHSHVLAFYGVAWSTSTSACGLMEFMNKGDLRSLLDAGTQFSWKEVKFEMALHIAKACHYLHSRSPVLIHRDLRAQNVLVHLDSEDKRYTCKLTNFTSARVRSYVDTMTSGVGSARWIAPEVLRGDDYSERVDIYSFGVVLCELDTQKLPFQDYDDSKRTLVQDIMTGKAIPQFSQTCPSEILHLAKQCLQLDPANRPTAAALVETLEKIVSEHAWVDRVTRTGGIYV
ncbi:hypothetical protein LEN26_018673 [Aphanomyces euteiches]|nr:hypothetical protein LEN26_018673 [Aphanomyces euteiches]KAH9128594.1 hypothetical protein AeMF1_001270 [Aphanomyces euteiches]KAH9193257.1 hypothetical protein AeNC1_004766 [Aphanomyces euteiches]